MDGMAKGFDILEQRNMQAPAVLERQRPNGGKQMVLPADIQIDRGRDSLLSAVGKAMLIESYLLPGEGIQDRFATVAAAYADNLAHAQRLYDYMSKLWFMPATPVLSNGGTSRGLPISCFLNEADDSLESIVDLWNENIWLASKGGGIGSYWGNLRSIGERVGQNGKTSGIIPFVRVMDSLTLAISQGSLRRGSAAVYLPIDHPEIDEFIELRRPTGGDPNRKALNLHHGVVIPDAFMHAVEEDADWPLLSPKDRSVVKVVKARDLWIRLLVARIETGEPYMLFIDTVNRAIPEHHRRSGLFVKTSNLCSEITLPTGRDHHDKARTAVCCLSSQNLDKWDEWSNHPTFVEDIVRFLDNVLDDFIARAPSAKRAAEEKLLAPLLQELRMMLGDSEGYQATEAALRSAVGRHFNGLMDSAIYSATRERSIGLGVMGFHSFLQTKGIPIESPLARLWNHRMFLHLKMEVDAASRKLAIEKGPCPDAAEHGILERFSNKTAIAPTASISLICGTSSPGIEPHIANVFNEKRLAGNFIVKNAALGAVLAKYGQDNDETWSSITAAKGSVQHLDFLSPVEKLTFKTAFEIDQHALVRLAADRAPLIDQAQSLNIFVLPDVHKKELHNIHREAWALGVKSLYYCRSMSSQRAQAVGNSVGWGSDEATFAKFRKAPEGAPSSDNYEVCESCQ